METSCEAISRQKLINAADPRNSRQLYQKVAELTGKDHAEFTKNDVIGWHEGPADRGRCLHARPPAAVIGADAGG